MEVTTMRAESRSEIGSKRLRHMRTAGRVPAVLYGRGKDPVHLSLEGHMLGLELGKRHKVFQLELAGGTEAAFLQAVQWNDLTDAPIHVDFKRIDLNEAMMLRVELTFVGLAVGIGKGGTFVKDATNLAVKAMPAAIPHHLEVKVAALGLGEELQAKDIELPDGVTLNCPPETRICHIPGLE